MSFARTSCLTALVALASPVWAADADPQTDTLLVQHPEIVVSATRTPRDQTDVPGAAAVITREELRRQGARTLGEALQNIVGLDTGEGSDNGSRLPNVGLWGLKEFDALLFTLNGVPVGGPFNPSLSQVSVDDVDRIEIVKGPQGTLYGVSAFAGMIQVFTPGAGAGGEASLGGGSFSSGHGRVAWGTRLGQGVDLRLTSAYSRSGGWQDRTEGDIGRGGATLALPVGRGRMTFDLVGYRDRQDWGSPLPFQVGALAPGFVVDRNYAVRGAEVEHQVWGGTSTFHWPLGDRFRIENTLGLTRDEQKYVRSFPGEVVGDTLESKGLALEPTETTLYEDVRLVARLNAAGAHELVAGAAVTWGTTRGKGREFSFDQRLSAYPDIPGADQVATVDVRDFEDRRTFFGVYVHDAWTPIWRLTLEAGGRFDATSEDLETEADLVSGPTRVRDEEGVSDFSGDLSAVVRLLPQDRTGWLRTANLYGSLRRGFKPAAPNLAEAEDAEILEPERTRSWEVGIKTRFADGLLLDASIFDMGFENLVVSILGPGGLPDLVNAGKERFRGVEADLRWSPPAAPGVSFQAGYAHHDARFVDFTLVTPEGELRDVSGNRLELVPRHLVNGSVSLRTAAGIGGFAAIRHQGERPFNRRNTSFAEGYTEWDGGLSYDRRSWRVSVVGRNLGDDRHVVTESEIGDAQFYVAPPRRFLAEIGYRF